MSTRTRRIRRRRAREGQRNKRHKDRVETNLNQLSRYRYLRVMYAADLNIMKWDIIPAFTMHICDKWLRLPLYCVVV